jgi:hypothetical protein
MTANKVTVYEVRVQPESVVSGFNQSVIPWIRFVKYGSWKVKMTVGMKALHGGSMTFSELYIFIRCEH